MEPFHLSSPTNLFVFTCLALPFIESDDKFVVNINKGEQKELLSKAKESCHRKIASDPKNITDLHCNRTWDDIMCWPDTPANRLAVQPCADYINGFNSQSVAVRQCMPNGEWYYNSENKSWSNYSSCSSQMEGVQKVPELIQKYMPAITLMYNIGYAVSLVTLLTAVLVMLYFRRLYCPRNTIHLNLFLSFILRALFSLLKDNLLLHKLAFPHDLQETPDGRIEFVPNLTHWQCKLFYSVLNYTVGTNFMWVFVEGLYLHMLIFVAVFTERAHTKWYILFGWTFPLMFMIPWIIARITLSDEHCWNTYQNKRIYWILRGPLVISVVMSDINKIQSASEIYRKIKHKKQLTDGWKINFCLFLNIVRVLFTKLNAVHNQETKKSKYRRLAKSTLILIPLFAVHIVFVMQPEKKSEVAELVLLSLEMFINSFQGFTVSVLLCFLNAEVQSEIKKTWHRHLLVRYNNNSYTSRAFQSLSEYFLKTRNSVSITDSRVSVRGKRNVTFQDPDVYQVTDGEDQQHGRKPCEENLPLKDAVRRQARPLTNGHASSQVTVFMEYPADLSLRMASEETFDQR